MLTGSLTDRVLREKLNFLNKAVVIREIGVWELLLKF